MALLPINKILVPTDFSDPARKALNSAIELAQQFSAELHLLHIMNPISPIDIMGTGPDLIPSSLPLEDINQYQDDLRQANQRILTEIIAKAQLTKLHIKHQQHIELGDAGSAIPAFAKAHDMDLIVISTHGLTGLSRFLMGSVTERVVRAAETPVMTVRHSQAKDKMI